MWIDFSFVFKKKMHSVSLKKKTSCSIFFKKCSLMNHVDTRQWDFVDWRRGGLGRWRLDREQQDSPSEKRYIRAEEFPPFLPASFVIL